MSYDLTKAPQGLAELDIPKELCLALVPQTSGSIVSLLQFTKLPKSIAPIEEHQKLTSAWFSHDPPEDSFDALAQLPQWPLPPSTVIRPLIELLQDGQRTRTGSIIPAHLSDSQQVHRLPLWVLTYWVNAAEALVAQSAWRKGVRWMDVQCQGFLEGTAMKQDVTEVLRTIHWKDTLHGPEMSSAPLETVASYLSFDWISGLHVADQVHSIHDELRAASWDFEFPHLLVDVEFSNHILDAHANADQYGMAKKFAYLRKVEHDLMHGLVESVGGLVHVNRNHYISFVVDVAASTIKFGDPMMQTIPEQVRIAFVWWLTQLLEGEAKQDGAAQHAGPISVTVDLLQVARQRDNNSCAILSLNALMHHYSPETTSLLNAGDKNSLVLERMRCAYRVLTFTSNT